MLMALHRFPMIDSLHFSCSAILFATVFVSCIVLEQFHLAERFICLAIQTTYDIACAASVEDRSLSKYVDANSCTSILTNSSITLARVFESKRTKGTVLSAAMNPSNRLIIVTLLILRCIHVTSWDKNDDALALFIVFVNKSHAHVIPSSSLLLAKYPFVGCKPTARSIRSTCPW